MVKKYWKKAIAGLQQGKNLSMTRVAGTSCINYCGKPVDLFNRKFHCCREDK
jgi:hypothetical protein